MSPADKNPYATAAGAYGTNIQKNTPDQRELEAHVLLKSAKYLCKTFKMIGTVLRQTYPRRNS